MCNGAQNNFLKECGVAYVFNPDQTKENVKKLFHIFSSNEELRYNANFLKNYYRRNNTNKLSLIFDKISVK